MGTPLVNTLSTQSQTQTANPEHRLLRALLRGALEDLSPKVAEGRPSYLAARKAEAQAARTSALAWLLSTSTKPFSFLWTCLHLNLSNTWLLRQANLKAGGNHDQPRNHSLGCDHTEPFR